MRGKTDMQKILVVDNHPVMLKFMENLLGGQGHKVLTAHDGLSALDVLKTFTPDVMFIDLKRDLKVGENIDVTLVFDDGSEKDLQVPVHKVMMKHKAMHSGGDKKMMQH